MSTKRISKKSVNSKSIKKQCKFYATAKHPENQNTIKTIGFFPSKPMVHNHWFSPLQTMFSRLKPMVFCCPRHEFLTFTAHKNHWFWGEFPNHWFPTIGFTPFPFQEFEKTIGFTDTFSLCFQKPL